MAQILTASRINDSWFATGLSPEVTITNISTGAVDVFAMEEVWNGNYKYVFNDYKDSIVYFFNFDSWTDDTINRYMSSSNNDVRVVYQQAGWTNASMNEEKNKENKLIKKIADEVEKRLEKDIIDNIENYIDIKHKETLGEFVSIPTISDIEIISWGIVNSIEKNTKDIQKNIKTIKYDDKKVKSLISDAIKLIKDKTDKKEILETLDTIEKQLKEEIKQRTKKDIKHKDIKKMKIEALEKSKNFKLLKLMTNPNFISLTKNDE